MADSPNTTSLPCDEMDMSDARDMLNDARHFVLCAQMAVANFGPSDDRVSAVQSATMAAIEKLEIVSEFLDGVRTVGELAVEDRQ